MTSPIQRWLQGLRRLFIERLRPGRDQEELFSVLGRAEALQSDEQRSMFEQLLVFHDTRVREVMIPRSSITSVASDASLAEVEQAMLDNGVGRLPVIDGDIDHVLGVVYAQDVASARVRGESVDLVSLLRPCLRVIELAQVSALLSEMREEGCHIAMVLDEYGGTAGLVTLSDLLQEIVGEIDDQGGEEESEIHPLTDGSYMVQGLMHIEDLCEELGVQLPQGDYDTVAGWIITRIGRIPKSGESLQLDGFQVHIVEADPRRVQKARLQRLQDIKER